MIKISVIIPCFNVEKYIEKAFFSLLNQDFFDDIEVIIINDGSNDSTEDICKKLSEEYDNVILFSQENKGLGMARNAGIDLATGDYIMFLDPDDWLINNSLRELYEVAKKECVDLISFSYLSTLNFDCDEDQIKNSNEFKSGDEYKLITKYEAHRQCASGNFNVQAVLKIYSRYIFEKVRFSDIAINEDAEIVFEVIEYAEKILVTNNTFYVQYIRPGSLMQQEMSEKNLLRLKVNRKMENFYKATYPELYAVVLQTSIKCDIYYASEVARRRGALRISRIKIFRKFYEDAKLLQKKLLEEFEISIVLQNECKYFVKNYLYGLLLREYLVLKKWMGTKRK